MFNIQVSKEYSKFVKREFETRRLSIYEHLCNFSERILSISVSGDRALQLREAIDFCHLKISPSGAFSFAILITLLLAFGVLLSSLLGLIPLPLALVLLLISAGVFYYLYNYPSSLATSFRIKASSEMVLTVIYMTVAMKVRPNIENAVAFTSLNLEGPLSLDLKELIWGVYTGKYISVEQALDYFIEKWKRENEEFTEAINLIKTSYYEEYGDRTKILNEAVSLVLDGTKNRMKHYSQDLRTSLTILNAMGILLPIIGLIFFPMMTIFMPQKIQPIFIVIGYNIILPLLVFWLISTSLRRRPYSFHHPDLSKHPEFNKTRLINWELVIPGLIFILLSGFGFYKIYTSEQIFSFGQLMYSLMITWGIAGGIISYCILSSVKQMKLRNEIVQMESELGVVLFQLGYQIRGGMAIENGIKKIKSKIKGLKISKMFGAILHNVQMFGLTFESAVFNEENGAIFAYPSKLISAVMRALVEISKSGMVVLSESMISISSFLKNMYEVEEYLKDMLSEVTSTMRTQALLLAPLASGIVVALVAMMMQMLLTLKEWVESFQTQLGTSGPLGMVGGSIFDSILNIDKIMPITHFQLIVGIYMLEVVGMLTIFLSIIEYGEESVMRKNNIGKMLLIGMTIYTFTLVLLYTLFTSLISIMRLGA